MKQANKVENIPFSPIRKIFDQVNVLKSQGKEVISLGIGEPDFDTPTHIVEAMYEATKKGATHYTPNKGIVELRQAIADKLLEDNQLNYTPEEIICTVGVSEAVYVALSAFLNPGDEILIPDPSWLNYGHVTTLNDAKAVYYPITSDNNFQINVEDLEKRVSSKTKIIIILDPSNPTGSVLSKETINEVAEFAKKHDLLVISDEIYEKIIYDDKKHYSIAALPGMRERTIVLNGFAKAYAMTGWRLGYIAAPAELIAPMAKIHSYMVTSASSMVQWGGVAALKGTQKPLKDMVEEFKIRRDYVLNEINSIKGLSCIKPEGAFYLFVDVKDTGMDGESFAKYLLETAGVAVVPGTAFGSRATHEVRISYATSLDNLEKAMANIKDACNKLSI
ncbi:aminotransferase [Tissierella praeacuta DSM 18095]|uniref:Aminotransferase n=1 Tax=Tissierella praeacuta DSM 18095 TaxID=1123404 RepID=A0A1M4TIN7_9FIRM|nr:pyridoxal phosphate-dependent aminotransferase [Tissierella praeacuta]TCU77502.1 aspartate aminotransferase/aminotransferase [Tissierella praeacuta]SHE44278.1 aminotransferase [Tissierella praeacuta DSM 18095]SUP04599.1 Aspartate aminotransferase [Tissierella praeacuta]